MRLMSLRDAPEFYQRERIKVKTHKGEKNSICIYSKRC